MSNKRHNIQKISKDAKRKAPTRETDAGVLENYPSFTADINIDKTDKNIKEEEVFDSIINQLPPDNNTVYIDHDKKNNKFRVKRVASVKIATKKSSRKRLKRKVQVHVIHHLGKRRPKNP